MKKGDFNFVWLFAIIAGSAILILMIYGAVRTGKTAILFQDTDLAKQVSVYLDPFQAGFTSSSKGTISSKKEIFFDSYCDSTNFGYQTLSAKQERDLNEDFNLFGEEITIKNKYLFVSKEPSKKFYVFSVPIEFAFKISDVLILDSREFCFLDGYEEIPNFKSTISVLGEKAKFDEVNCTEDSLKVCFGYRNDCDIQVVGECTDTNCNSKYEIGKIIKNGESLNYVGNLLYPAIFSEKEIYDCNIKRILYKNGILSLIYIEKSDRMSSRNCPTDLTSSLEEFSKLSFDLNSDLEQIYFESKLIKESEALSQCKLWSE